MNWNSSRHWQHGRHRGNGWVIPLVIIGLIILTQGWIIFLPLMVLAGFILFGVVLPKVVWHVKQSGWQDGNWSCSNEKRKHHFHSWDGEKPKRHDSDEIEYV